MLNPRALEYLWSLFISKFKFHDELAVSNIISSLYDGGLDLPAELEAQLLLFWQNRDVKYLLEALKVGAQRYYFDLERHVILIAYLIDRNVLAMEEAQQLLSVPARSLAGVRPEIKNVIDTVWLINQDESAGYASSPEESLLRDALREALKDFA